MNEINSHNGHEYVDLELPSGTLWATCNIGASSPEEDGDYFAWGEVKTQTEYIDRNYLLYSCGYYKKYNETDGLYELEDSDDAAMVIWGNGWRMPSEVEFEELRYNCIFTWDMEKKGYDVKSRINGNMIFLPAAGYRREDSLFDLGTNGYYWTRSRVKNSMDSVSHFEFGNTNSKHIIERYFGLPIRPVCNLAK